MIQTKNLVKRYGNFTAVSGINLNIAAGEIYGFLGPNGAGKTSTIMMLLGILEPSEGEIFLFNEKFSPNRFDLKKKIGVVPEKHPTGVWKWMTAGEYLRLFADEFEVEEADKRVAALLDRVGLSEVRDKRFSEFSRGMLQKLSIVRALLHDPEILFLDEPISGLDPIGIKQIRDLIAEENENGRTIFISSHLLSEIEKVCDRVAIISQGKLLAEDKMDVLLSGLSKDREILIDLEEIPEGLIDDVNGLDFVIETSSEGNTLIVTVPKEGDYRKSVSQFLFKKNLLPLRIGEKALSLEEAFVTISQDNVEYLATIGGQK